MSLFDEVDSRPQQQPIRPLFTVNQKNEKELHDWLKNAVQVLIEKEEGRHAEVAHNFKLYKGAEGAAKEARPRTQEGDTKARRKERLIVNHLFDITETQIARITRYKPAVSISPTNDEYIDKVAAKITKQFLDDIWYRQDVDSFVTRLHRRARIAGEDYIHVYWDKDAGGEHPKYKEALKEAGPDGKVPLLDESGEHMRDAQDRPRYIEGAVSLGEVKYELVSTRRLLLEPQKRWGEDLNYVIHIDTPDADELRAEYPNKSEKIKTSSQAIPGFDDDAMKDLALKNRVVRYRIHHKKSKYLKDGAYIVATQEGILEKGKCQYDHGRLPFIRITDIDDEEDGAQHGYSFFANIEALQHAYNNSSSMILQNQALMSYPKWMMPKGACEISSLNNDRTIVQYKGAVEPKLVQANPTGAEVFKFREDIRAELRQIGGGSQQDRGEPPAGITAGVALQYLDEQVQERFNTYVAKHNDLTIELAELTLLTAGQYYQDDEGRLEKVLGRSDIDSIAKFSVRDLAKPFHIRIQNASALPDSKAAKTQTIIDLKKEFPDLFTSEQVVELLDLGSVEKMNNMATMSIRAAEAENEDLKQGIPVKEPEEFEFHLQHWRVHTQAMQERSFKELPPEMQQRFKDHVLATELLMYQQGLKSPAFAQQLTALPMFPMLYNPDPMQNAVANPAAAAAMAQAGAAGAPAPQDPSMGAYQTPPEGLPLEQAPPMNAGAPLAPDAAGPLPGTAGGPVAA